MKTKIKTNTAHNYNNTKKIINWSDYNKSLKNRGNLSIFISESIVKDGRIVVPPKSGKVGRPMEYTDELIEFVLTIRELFRLPLRQTTGFVEFLFKSMGIYSSAPDYTTVSKRMAIIKVRYQKKMDKYSKNGDGIVLLIDSSGFKVFGEGEWKVRKHGASKRRTWRETHVVINHETRDIMGFTNTAAHTYDNTQLKPLLEQVSSEGYNIDTIIGDGAYEVKDNYELVAKFNASIIAPPHKNAIFHYDLKDGKLIDMPGYERRNKVIRAIMRAGGLEEWKNKVGYHRRSLIENAFYRWKTIFGNNLKSRKEITQYTEQCLRAKIINKFNELGLPKYELAS